jgi:hypothetical protein
MTTPLGKSFPEEFRKTFCQDHLIPGAVLRFHTPHTTPPKIKRSVVIAINEESVSIALTYINTRKPSSPYLLPWQMFIESRGREYLDHDSYLDCAQLYEEDLVKIKRLLIGDTSTFLGQMSKKDFIKAKKLIISAKSISAKLKKKYGLEKWLNPA